ncbi:DNA topoisomerase 2-alpha-like [Haemaphysalis longicornis]
MAASDDASSDSLEDPRDARGQAKQRLKAARRGRNKVNEVAKDRVEDIYQRKKPREHILHRPDTFIGATEPVKKKAWVYHEDDGEDGGMKYRAITYVPGLFQIFNEILMNAADNKQRDNAMDSIEINVDSDRGEIRVKNNGKGIPVVYHAKEKILVPTLLFGRLLSSSNYDDDDKTSTAGRNGYGAKLANIFSKCFMVETYSGSEKAHFAQKWKNNMKSGGKPEVTYGVAGTDFTEVTFEPDLGKFHLKEMDRDFVALLHRRAFDLAGCLEGVTVYFNEKELPVSNFKQYVQLYTRGVVDENGDPLVVPVGWDVAVTKSPDGYFRQISFVNNLATTMGGGHVDCVVDQLVKKILTTVRRKTKNVGVNITSRKIKDFIWLFLKARVENPKFGSQTKELLTVPADKFSENCCFKDSFYAKVVNCGIVEAVSASLVYRVKRQLETKVSGQKTPRIKGIPKLEDANDAGTEKSMNCTLILTEGDSAKSLAVSGLGIVGRDTFGVFPLKGKVLNVRVATCAQELKNAELNNLTKAIGLQHGKLYETMEDLQTLRYGRVMAMCDQDQDGSHIKGLLINFIHKNWPSLLKLPFLEEFITPIVKASKGASQHAFYSLPEYEEWKRSTPDWQRWKVKYYKGLGTSTSKEAKEYFSNISRHRVEFTYEGPEDDQAIVMAFSKTCVEERKQWLTRYWQERRQRREQGLPEPYLYSRDTSRITYKEFVDKELVLFSAMDNERSIPCVVDGLKPAQRKVMFTSLRRADHREIKVAQMAGCVAEQSAYHHGEASLMATIVHLAQNFVGTNNVNLLQPIGQFGTRLQGGKDAASPRYIYTALSPLARLVFPELDDTILKYAHEDNRQIEPEYFLPVIPLVLVNGAEGIGTGWSTRVPNYNPHDIIKSLLLMLAGEEAPELKPWYKNFRGSIDQVSESQFVISGEVSILDEKTIEITELPLRTWTQCYKEGVLEPLLHSSDRLIEDYQEYHTDTTVRFVVTLSKEKLRQTRVEGLHKVFKLQTTLSTRSMVLFDSNGVLTTYRNPSQILEEFYATRLAGYKKRYEHYVGLLSAETKKMDNQLRFTEEMLKKGMTIGNQPLEDMVRALKNRGYAPDPVGEWKKQQASCCNVDEERDMTEEGFDAGPYLYLLKTNMLNLSTENVGNLRRKLNKKKHDLEELREKTPKDLWREDLSALQKKLSDMEKAEQDKASRNRRVETEPSPSGRRVKPVFSVPHKDTGQAGAAASDESELEDADHILSFETVGDAGGHSDRDSDSGGSFGPGEEPLSGKGQIRESLSDAPSDTSAAESSSAAALEQKADSGPSRSAPARGARRKASGRESPAKGKTVSSSSKQAASKTQRKKAAASASKKGKPAKKAAP